MDGVTVRAAAGAGSVPEPVVALRRQQHVGGVGGSEAQQVAAQPNLDRIAKRGAADHLDSRPRQQSHLHEAAADARCTADTVDDGRLPDRQLIERAKPLVHLNACLPLKRTASQ